MAWCAARCLAPCPGPGQAGCGDYRHAWRGVGEVRVVVKSQGVVRLGRLSCAVAPRARCLMCQRSSPDRASRRLRLLSCHRAVEYPAPLALTVERATGSEIPRT